METDEPKRGIRKFLLKRMLFVPLGIVALAATSYARKYPDWAEHVYAQGVYPALSSVVGFLPSLVSFSVAEWVAALFLLFCPGYLVFCLSLIHIYRPRLVDEMGVLVVPERVHRQLGRHARHEACLLYTSRCV